MHCVGLECDQLPAATVLHDGEGLDERLAQQREVLGLEAAVCVHVVVLVESSG